MDSSSALIHGWMMWLSGGRGCVRCSRRPHFRWPRERLFLSWIAGEQGILCFVGSAAPVILLGELPNRRFLIVLRTRGLSAKRRPGTVRSPLRSHAVGGCCRGIPVLA
jgi:hypothetical protein